MDLRSLHSLPIMAGLPHRPRYRGVTTFCLSTFDARSDGATAPSMGICPAGRLRYRGIATLMHVAMARQRRRWEPDGTLLA